MFFSLVCLGFVLSSISVSCKNSYDFSCLSLYLGTTQKMSSRCNLSVEILSRLVWMNFPNLFTLVILLLARSSVSMAIYGEIIFDCASYIQLGFNHLIPTTYKQTAQ